MKRKTIQVISKKAATDIMFPEKVTKELKAIKERKINLSDKDTPEITNWDNTIVGKFYRPIKK